MSQEVVIPAEHMNTVVGLTIRLGDLLIIHAALVTLTQEASDGGELFERMGMLADVLGHVLQKKGERLASDPYSEILTHHDVGTRNKGH